MTSRNDVRVLFDSDLSSGASMTRLVEICARAIDADASGSLVAPPRHSVDFGTGRLVLTTGGFGDTVGFRAYDTFPGSRQDQVVAVWDRSAGTLTGLVIGDRLGALRTGAIGGVAVDRLARRDVATCAVIGAGKQAKSQLAACCAVRSLSHVRVFSRSADSRARFAHEMSNELEVDVRPVESARSAVSDADVVLIATSSAQPVVDHRDIHPEAHINTVGPKFRSAHEISAVVAEHAVRIASDSPQQIIAQGDDYFIARSPAMSRIEHLGRLGGNAHGSGQSLFLSAGLAGTEVLVADALVRAHSST